MQQLTAHIALYSNLVPAYDGKLSICDTFKYKKAPYISKCFLKFLILKPSVYLMESPQIGGLV